MEHYGIETAYYLDELGVGTQFQRQGIGATILNSFVRRMSQEGFRWFVLKTAEGPENFAPRLYLKCGFRVLEDEHGNEIRRLVSQERTDGVTRDDWRVYYYNDLLAS